jgi:hypothetical protein
MTIKIRKYFLIATLACMLVSISTNAQLTRIGGGLAFSPGIDNITYETGNPGFNVRGVFELGDKLWAVPSLTFYMPKSRTDQNTGDIRKTFLGSLDANVTYTLTTESTLLFYALGGLNLTGLQSNYKTDDPALEDVSEFLPGINIGTGIEMIVAEDINAITQIKYVLGMPPAQYVVISVGVHYYITGRRFRKW